MRKVLLVLLVAVVSMAIASCDGYKRSESETATKAATKEMPKKMPKDIVDIAVADGRFKTLVTAVKAADLVETLKGKGPYTVFAPTDDAFAKLPPGTVEGLLEDIPTLKNILLYHVVPGKVMASQVVELDKAGTALGKDVMIKVMDGKVMVDDAQVIITDIEASNGVIHVIDTVILPPEM
jgi:transforming growth factor-beta-induced protein